MSDPDANIKFMFDKNGRALIPAPRSSSPIPAPRPSAPIRDGSQAVLSCDPGLRPRTPAGTTVQADRSWAGQVPDPGPEVPDPGPEVPDPGPPVPAPAPAPVPAPVPLERLEAQICELAGHLTAATCRFLVLLADFDARRGWASWDMNSCASWLSWKCQMSSGTAREHVRVARALRDLPVIRAEFAAARLSYAKVRALTRIATPEHEQGLAEIAGPMTGNQLERFARAHRQVTSADDAAARIRRRLTWRFEEDGSLAGTFRLPPLAGAVLLKALRAAAGDLEHPHDDGRSRGNGGRGGSGRQRRTAADGHVLQPGRRPAGHRGGIPGRPGRGRR